MLVSFDSLMFASHIFSFGEMHNPRSLQSAVPRPRCNGLAKKCTYA